MQLSNIMKKLFIGLVAILSLTACTSTEYSIFSTLYGTVSDYETGDPIGSVSVVLSPGGITKITGNDGYFEFQDLTPQQYTVTVQKEGYTTNRKQINAVTGENTEVNITMSK